MSLSSLLVFPQFKHVVFEITFFTISFFAFANVHGLDIFFLSAFTAFFRAEKKCPMNVTPRMNVTLRPLFSGESSTVYVCDNLKGCVIKKTTNLVSHKREVAFYLKCKRVDTVPLLITHFIHDGCGYLQLEKISPFKIRCQQFDMSKLNVRCQLRLIGIFTYFTDLGFIHMDSHIGNIGINQKGNIVVYDFEYAQKRLWHSAFEKTCAIVFSLFLALDFVCCEQIETSCIWRYARNALHDDIFTWCDKQMTQNFFCRKSIFLKKAKNLSHTNTDIVFLCLASIIVIKTPLEQRFNLSLYNDITSIQRCLGR